MKPLDLRVGPPRPARDALLGVYLLARTIDKLRAELPGGNIGEYLNDELGFSAFVVRRLGLTMNELREIVAQAADEAEVIDWLRDRIDPGVAAALNAKLETFVLERMSPEDQNLVRARHPVLATRADLTKILDILDADDQHVFGKRSETI